MKCFFGVRGQASIEYMVMLALSLAIFTAILYVSTTLISSSSAQIGLDSAYRAVEHVRESSDFIYIHGHPSKTQVNVYIPPNVEEFGWINNDTVHARISVEGHYTDIYSVARGDLTGDLSGISHEGYFVVDLESISDDVISVTLV